MSETADMAAAAAPTEAHDQLQPFEGTFKAEVKMWMGPGEPHVTTGTMTNTRVLGGRFLQQDYQGDAIDGPFPSFEGKGYWGYNTLTHRFEGFWIDTASTQMQTEQGSVNEAGTEWTMTGTVTCAGSGDPMSKRSVIRLIDRDHHQMETYFQGADGNEMKVMEIQYVRVEATS
ncbi:MAG: DUF1579 domain-containing protein [Planctomycetota bacterium]